MKVKKYKIPYLKIDGTFPINATINQFLTLRKLFRIEANSEKPWIIIRFLGVFPIFAHYDVEEKDFLQFGADAENPEKRLSTLIQKFENGEKNSFKKANIM